MTEAQRILKSRAELLARPEPLPLEDLREFVEFTVGSRSYCLESASLSGVHPAIDWTPLPGTPPFVVGLMAVRGRILSILSLRALLSPEEGGLVDHPQVLLLADEDGDWGLVVDTVVGTVKVERREIVPAPQPASRYATGLFKDSVVLDAGLILRDPSILVLQGGSA